MTKDKALILVRGIAGGVAGGLVGFVVFQWLARHRLYGMMIPGALIGVGAGWAARGRSQALGIVCAVAAVGLAIFCEWKLAPFRQDGRLIYFVTHLHQMDGLPVKVIMMGLGAAFAYWFGQGR